MTKTPVLATLVSTFDFTKDGKQIAAVLVPDTRTAMPQAPASPPGPTVKLAMETDKNRLRTFPSLMSTPYEEQLLEWHATGQLALVDVAKGTVKRVGAPAMIRAIDLAPDGKFVRVTRMLKPFSYDVPVSQLRVDRGDLGRQRQVAREDQRPSAEPRRGGRHAAAARSDAGAGGRRRRRPRRRADRQARSRVARRRPGPDLRRGGTGSRERGARTGGAGAGNTAATTTTTTTD